MKTKTKESVDMSNKQYKDYREFLIEKKLTDKNKVHYYVNWVDQFTQFCGRKVKNVTWDNASSFIQTLAQKEYLKDWQVRQADDSVTIFINNYLKEIHNIDVNKYSKKFEIPVSSGKNSWDIIQNSIDKIIKLRRYSPKTGKTYRLWVNKFAEYLGYKSPSAVTPDDVKNFLTFLASKRRVAASTQNQAFNSLLFLFRHILVKDLKGLDNTLRAKTSKRLPVVLSVAELQNLLNNMSGTSKLIAEIIYGGGLRVNECLNLRVKDIDFEKSTIMVRAGKGDKDRVTLLAKSVKERLQTHLAKVKELHLQDLDNGYGRTQLPNALVRKYPKADRELIWQWLFPAGKIARDPATGFVGRYHVFDTTLRRKIKEAVQSAGIMKRVKVHTLRHCFATHLLENGCDIRMIQELLGHKSIETTMIYTHVIGDRFKGIASPLDNLEKA